MQDKDGAGSGIPNKNPFSLHCPFYSGELQAMFQQITKREIKQPISVALKPLCWRHPRREPVLDHTAQLGSLPFWGRYEGVRSPKGPILPIPTSGLGHSPLHWPLSALLSTKQSCRVALPTQEFTNKARETAGAVWERKQFFLHWLPPPLPPPFLQAQKWKIRVERPAAPHKPDEGRKEKRA